MNDNNPNNPMRSLFSTNLFDSTPKKTTDNPFGTQPSLPSQSSAFGQTTTPFGSTNQFQSTTPFGQSASPVFGSNLSQGNQPSQFGSTYKPFTAPQFGQQQSQFQPNNFNQSAFGNQQNSMFSGVLNQNTTNAPFGGSTGWPGDNQMSQTMFQQKKGTGDPVYSKSRKRDEHGIIMELHHILGMEEYKNKSLEELRKEDYEAGRKPTKIETKTEFKPFVPTAVSTPQPFQVSTPSIPPVTQNPFQQQTVASPSIPQMQPSISLPIPSSQPPAPSFPTIQPQSIISPPSMPPTMTSMPQRPTFPTMGVPSFPSLTPTYPPQPVASPMFEIDTSDPFLIKNLRFEKVPPKKITLRNIFPTERIFKEKKEDPKISLSVKNYGYTDGDKPYTIPPLYEISHLDEIDNLAIVLPNRCKIEFLEPVTVYSLENLEDKIYMRGDEIEMTDAPGEGINKRARVTITGHFPYINKMYSTGDYEAAQEKFYYKLQNTKNRTFVDYIEETGTYVYEVDHF